jgi:hypothetical protein
MRSQIREEQDDDNKYGNNDENDKSSLVYEKQ